MIDNIGVHAHDRIGAQTGCDNARVCYGDVVPFGEQVQIIINGFLHRLLNGDLLWRYCLREAHYWYDQKQHTYQTDQ
jgi:hypothetical protein